MPALTCNTCAHLPVLLPASHRMPYGRRTLRKRCGVTMAWTPVPPRSFSTHLKTRSPGIQRLLQHGTRGSLFSAARGSALFRATEKKNINLFARARAQPFSASSHVWRTGKHHLRTLTQDNAIRRKLARQKKVGKRRKTCCHCALLNSAPSGNMSLMGCHAVKSTLPLTPPYFFAHLPVCLHHACAWSGSLNIADGAHYAAFLLPALTALCLLCYHSALPCVPATASLDKATFHTEEACHLQT